MKFKKKHKHNWKPMRSFFVLADRYPREILRCKCGKICHVPVLSKKQIEESENE